MFDLVIIGAGPAGLSAAIHAKRLGLNCVVLERGTVGGQARAANWITNYPGFPNGISGCELMELFIKQAEEAGVRIEKCEVKRVSLREDPTNVGATKQSSEDNCYSIDVVGAGICLPAGGVVAGPRPVEGGRGGPPLSSKSIILATGLEPVRIGGEGIFYYPVPEEVPHEGKNVLIIGGGDSAFDEAISFSKKAAHVTIAMRSDKPRALEGLVKQANEAGIKIMAGMTDGDIARLKAEVTVACCGKRPKLDILESVLQVTSHQSLVTLQLAGDIAHPHIRHIAAAVGDGVRVVEELNQHFLAAK